jgi:FHA domain-containing protein
MSVLRNLEEKLAGLVEGTFGRVFRTQVRPVEIARKLAREMDEHKTVSVSRTYVPNEYAVWLSPEDRERFEGVEHARRERLALISRPQIEFRTDDRLSLGEFGIQARMVRTHEAQDDAEQGDHGKTMVYSTSSRVQEELHEARTARAGRAMVVAEGKRMPVGPGGAVIGRSRECDIVLQDSNVSRRHAEIRPSGGDGWTIADLGSTNGVKVNGRQIASATPLQPGDDIAVGTVDVKFEVER